MRAIRALKLSEATLKGVSELPRHGDCVVSAADALLTSTSGTLETPAKSNQMFYEHAAALTKGLIKLG